MLRSASLVLLLSSGLSVAACSAPGGEKADAQTANATGGEARDYASFLHVFAPGEDAPVCAGAIIADTAIVVPRDCAREDLLVGLASRGDRPMFWNKANVTKVHVPASGPADIAVLEIEKKLAPSANRVTRAPLRSGYTIFARQSVRDGILGNPVGATTQIPASFQWMTDTQITMTPTLGAKLCQRDLGAMVCSSTEPTGLLGSGPRDRCGLAGIVVAPPSSALDENECSGEGWKVAPLGLYREFLEPFAPNLFDPIVDAGIFGTSTYVPEGLWGHESAGEVTSCELVTKQLEPAPKQVRQPVRAKASFEGMAARAEAVAQFGLAKKASPTTVTWVPSTRAGLETSAAFDDTFTTDIGAANDGEYVISLRVSANGGETWKRCDDASKPLHLEVREETETETETAPAPAPTPTPAPTSTPDAGTAEEPPVTDDAPPPAGDDEDSEADTKKAPGTPKKDAENASESGARPTSNDPVVPAATNAPDAGCSTAPGGSSSGPGLPAAGVLLGLAALVRRRK